MSLVRKIQPLSETSGQVRLEPCDVFPGEALEMSGAGGELHQIRRIAPMRDHQRAVHDGAGEALPPPGDTLRTEARDQRLAALQLAPRRQHAAGKPGARARAELPAALEDLHGDAALGELERAGEPCDPGPDDADAHGVSAAAGAARARTARSPRPGTPRPSPARPSRA